MQVGRESDQAAWWAPGISQGQPITEAKSIRWREFRKIVAIKFLDNVGCSELCHVFSLLEAGHGKPLRKMLVPLDRDHGITI